MEVLPAHEALQMHQTHRKSWRRNCPCRGLKCLIWLGFWRGYVLPVTRLLMHAMPLTCMKSIDIWMDSWLCIAVLYADTRGFRVCYRMHGSMGWVKLIDQRGNHQNRTSHSRWWYTSMGASFCRVPRWEGRQGWECILPLRTCLPRIQKTHHWWEYR